MNASDRAAPTTEARTPEEWRFVGSEAWRGADVRGRILRPMGNGFVMLTDEDEKSFAPVKVGLDGKIENDPSLKDDVSAAIGSLAFCRPVPPGVYRCTSSGRDGREAVIPEIPIGAPL